MMRVISLPTLFSANHRHPGYFGSDLKQHVPEDHLTIFTAGIDSVRRRELVESICSKAKSSVLDACGQNRASSAAKKFQ
jgi:hypothetical protein